MRRGAKWRRLVCLKCKGGLTPPTELKDTSRAATADPNVLQAVESTYAKSHGLVDAEIVRSMANFNANLKRNDARASEAPFFIYSVLIN